MRTIRLTHQHRHCNFTLLMNFVKPSEKSRSGSQWPVFDGCTIKWDRPPAGLPSADERIQYVVPGGQTRAYRPLSDELRLYRLFSETPSDGVAKFASTYGLLGIPRPDCDDAELLQDWNDEIVEMFMVLRWWDYLQGRVSTDEAVIPARILTEYCRLEGSRFWERNIKKALSQEIQKRLSVRIERHCGLTIVSREGEEPPFSIEVTPRNLLGVLWYQAALAVAERQDHFLCPVC